MGNSDGLGEIVCSVGGSAGWRGDAESEATTSSGLPGSGNSNSIFKVVWLN